MLKPMTEQTIKGIAKFGAQISKHCRDAWTGKQVRVSVKCEKVSHPYHRAGRQVLDYLGLIEWENVADLNQFRLGVSNQHTWTAQDWERAIRFRAEHGRDAQF